MDALTFVERSSKAKPAPLFVLAGDEDFLKRQALAKLTADLLGDADPAFAVSAFEGDKAEWRPLKSELDTLPFLSPRRLVVVEQADGFVTNNRARLEEYAASDAGHGTLILEVKSWPGNTRLAKMTPEAATITCKSPQAHRLAPWCRKWAESRYSKELSGDAAEWLVELVGPGMGLLDQEIAKLATATGDNRIMTREAVGQFVGRSRQAETFKIFDAIGNGRAAEAVAILERLFQQGEDPHAILGAFSWQLRRLAAVSRAARGGLALPAALDRAGVQPWARDGVEKQLRHLGRQRMDRIYDWLLEADQGMKGGSALPPRLILEQLVARLARTTP